MRLKTVSTFEGVREWSDDFLALFPHRFDYIYAKHPEPGQSPDWYTESRHPLSDRLIHQGSYIYGVRFGSETCYCMVDIDTTSVYHPVRDRFAIARITSALEPLGLVNSVLCTSSYSGGLHLYFPFHVSQSSWQLAIGVTTLLENAGFKVSPGQLEIFPNPRPYSPEQTPSLFNAHRLPMQAGSYLLNEEFQPVWSDQSSFVRQWKFAQDRNDLNLLMLKQVLKQAKRRQFQRSGKVEKFINDLNAEIEVGWTGYGQTNRLLGRITMRAYIFHHILASSEPLEGQSLIDEIVSTARSLPGYIEWCRHQHEIEQRAAEWARCIENSHYFHYGDSRGKFNSKLESPELNQAIAQTPTWNQQRSAATRDRIKRAIADLLEKGTLPAQATARFHCLLTYGIGGGSLYRHRDLWHPYHLTLASSRESAAENPPHPPVLNQGGELDCVGDASNSPLPTSLFPIDGGNVLPQAASSDLFPLPLGEMGSNSARDRVSCSSGATPAPGAQYIQQVLFRIKASRSASQDAIREALRQAQAQRYHFKSQAAEQRHRVRMQQFLESGDPILVAEALAWVHANPEGVQLGDRLKWSHQGGG